jgi:hypothetical protein
MTLYVQSSFSAGNILTYLNSLVAVPMSGAESTDATAIKTHIDGLANVGAKLQYVSVFHALNLIAETDSGGLLTETVWRNQLGI